MAKWNHVTIGLLDDDHKTVKELKKKNITAVSIFLIGLKKVIAKQKGSAK